MIPGFLILNSQIINVEIIQFPESRTIYSTVKVLFDHTVSVPMKIEFSNLVFFADSSLVETIVFSDIKEIVIITPKIKVTGMGILESYSISETGTFEYNLSIQMLSLDISNGFQGKLLKDFINLH